jgi:hypothetical protein
MMDEQIKPENETQEAVTEEVKTEEAPETPKKKKRTDLVIELALFFILGLLIGIAVKTEASKTITIGYNDYMMKIHSQGYDINKLQIDLAKKSAGADTSGEETAPAEGTPPTESGENESQNAAPADQGQPNSQDNQTVPEDNQAQSASEAQQQ